MTLNQKFWETLPLRVREVILHAAKHPSERNTCYAAGYIRGAQDFGGLLYDHYSFLLSVLCDEGVHANWHETVKGFPR